MPAPLYTAQDAADYAAAFAKGALASRGRSAAHRTAGKAIIGQGRLFDIMRRNADGYAKIAEALERFQKRVAKMYEKLAMDLEEEIR